MEPILEKLTSKGQAVSTSITGACFKVIHPILRPYNTCYPGLRYACHCLSKQHIADNVGWFSLKSCGRQPGTRRPGKSAQPGMGWGSGGSMLAPASWMSSVGPPSFFAATLLASPLAWPSLCHRSSFLMASYLRGEAALA
jgi:hypothetical protein